MRERFQFYYDIRLEFQQPVRHHAFVLRCIPPSFPGQKVLEASLTLDPQVSYTLQQDGFGNLLQLGCLEEPHDHLHYTVQGAVHLAPEERAAEPCPPIFRFPSAYTQPSPEMERFFQVLELPAGPAGRAWALSQAVRARLAYAPGVTSARTTAAQAFALGKGVCQDFAHVYLTLAHLAGLPARYVNGLPLGEGASHAWCEVWLDGVWTGIDPTRGCWADRGYIRFGLGRDFGDCPIERGVFLGSTGQRQTVYMKVSQQ